MGNFKKQIEEDIRLYQEHNPFIQNIQKDEWAFNYWILDKIFYEEEDIIESKITDYKDLGIDAYEFYEDTKELYLIQNKYYNETSKISDDYIKNNFLLKPIKALENGTYTRCPELQTLYTKYKNADNFMVYMQIYVTNNMVNKEVAKYIRKFNCENPQYKAEIFYLDDIERKYYDDVQQIKQDIIVEVESVNNGTILNVNTEDYKLANILDAKYVFTPVTSVFRIYRDAKEKGYPIFDMNIREYLGNKGINNGIYKTLLDEEERKNFFYYNNGITMICEKLEGVKAKPVVNNIHVSFKVKNPQIVNGCQTVNSIYEALKNVEPDKLEKEFKDTFVMLKVLEIDRQNEKEEVLYKNIVKYNNSQNSIDEKTFVANSSVFVRIQREFESKGFLLLIKQSDKNKFKEKYGTTTKLKERSEARLKKFGLELGKNVSDFYIPLEKLLQVIMAFKEGGHFAYNNKKDLLKVGTEKYNSVVEFIKDGYLTNDILLDLYMFYLKAEKNKKTAENPRVHIPYYMVDAMAKYDCNERKIEMIEQVLCDNEKIKRIYKLYSKVTKMYMWQYCKDSNCEYNFMIKKNIDYNLLDRQRELVLQLVNE